MTDTGKREDISRIRRLLCEIAIVFSLFVGALWLAGAFTELRLYFAAGLAFVWAQHVIILDGIEDTRARLSDLSHAIGEIEREVSLMRRSADSN
jgi:fatty acid desaturase